MNEQDVVIHSDFAVKYFLNKSMKGVKNRGKCPSKKRNHCIQ